MELGMKTPANWMRWIGAGSKLRHTGGNHRGGQTDIESATRMVVKRIPKKSVQIISENRLGQMDAA